MAEPDLCAEQLSVANEVRPAVCREAMQGGHGHVVSGALPTETQTDAPTLTAASGPSRTGCHPCKAAYIGAQSPYIVIDVMRPSRTSMMSQTSTSNGL